MTGLFLLAGCGGGGTIPSNFLPQIEEYQGKDHYRAFASTATAPSPERAYGSSWSQGSIDKAIDDALERCRNHVEVADSCRVHYLGDIDVSGLNEEEFARAKAVYRDNLSASIDDL